MYDENPYAPPAAKVLDRIAQQDVEESELADRSTRLLGAIIDGLLIMAIVLPWKYFSGYWAEVMSGHITLNNQLQDAGIGMLAYLLLNGSLLARQGQTLGKRLLGMRIVSVKDGQILPFWKILFLRYIPMVLLSETPLTMMLFGQISLIGSVDPLLIFRKDRRCLHDHLAGSKVIRVEM